MRRGGEEALRSRRGEQSQGRGVPGARPEEGFSEGGVDPEEIPSLAAAGASLGSVPPS